MNTLTLLNNRRWNPFEEMDALNDLFFGKHAGSVARSSSEPRDWVPLVDIVENDSSYLIKAELPEVDKKDISVKVEDGVLTIAGERKSEVETEEKKIHRIERSYGRFVRTFRVPENGDAANVSAEFKDGVLRVSVPKVPESQPKAVDITVA
jgi:HSP20 family protein